MKQYLPREGATFGKAKAQIIGKVLEELEAKDSNITPEALVAYSKPVGSLTHDLFEWSDTKAAKEFRKLQARNIINKIYVVCEEIGGGEVKAYYPVVTLGENSYVSAKVAAESEDYSNQIMRRTISMLESSTRELESFKRYNWVVNILRNTTKKIKARVKVK